MSACSNLCRIQARKLLTETLRTLILERRESGKHGGGLLGILLRAKDHKFNGLSDSQIADNIIGVIFAAHDTTASVLTWVLKYLHDNADVMESVAVNSCLVILLPLAFMLEVLTLYNVKTSKFNIFDSLKYIFHCITPYEHLIPLSLD